MITEEQIKISLQKVFIPGTKRSVIDFNLVRKIAISENKVTITFATTALSKEIQEFLSANITTPIQKLNIDDVAIEFVEAKPSELNDVKQIIAIMSGKGGVGKSLVTSLLAIALKRQGKEVGILDADITGPSIPRMFGLDSHILGSETGLFPVVSDSGIEVMSMNLLLPQEDSAVIWRAPLLSKAISQFWTDVLWGKLDYLLIDLPPGTADAPLTVMQSLPVNGVIIVSTPQGLVEMIVKKAINMAQTMNKPILGIVENMSYFYVPEIKKKFEIFGESKGEALAKVAQAPLLGQLPIDPELARLCDNGDIEHYTDESVASLGKSLLAALEIKTGK
jgi:Mrp family chromosome partitioning ATPase